MDFPIIELEKLFPFLEMSPSIKMIIKFVVCECVYYKFNF